MLAIPVVNADGQTVSTIEVDPSEFGGEVNRQLLHDAVVMYQANLRVGTHKAKTRGEVSGSGRKMYRQKGTGNARMGDKRTGKRKGGGAAFGPQPRDYSYAMPKKARRIATRMALLSKLEDDEAVVIDNLAVAQPKTKAMIGLLAKLGLGGQTCLIATASVDRNVWLSSRNIRGVQAMPTAELNAYVLLKQKRLLLTLDALQSLRGASKPIDQAGEEAS